MIDNKIKRRNIATERGKNKKNFNNRANANKSLCKNIKRINNWYDEKFFFFFISLREKLQRYEITLLQQRRSKKYVD